MANSPTRNQPNDQLNDWLTSIGVIDQFTANDLETGKTVVSILKSLSKQTNLQLQLINSAINRVNNWNAIIEELKKVSIKVTQEQKSKIINGNHDVIFHIISRLREGYQKTQKETEINVQDIDPKKELASSSSMLELMILALIKSFTLSPKEAIALLSNEGKYLAHILAKGFKGEFKPIQNLLADCFKSLTKILEFSKNHQNQSFFLKSIKPALICKSEAVAEGCLQLLFKFTMSYSKIERIRILKDFLINTILLVMKRHPHLNLQVIDTIVNICEYDKEGLALIFENIAVADTNNIFILLWEISKKDQKCNELLSIPNIENIMNSIISGLKESDHVISCLHIMVEVGSVQGLEVVLADNENKDQISQNLLQVSLAKQAEIIVFFHECFSLLAIAGSQKHFIAPFLFKFLLSKLNASQSQTSNEIILMNFTYILKQFPSIPFAQIVGIISQKIESGSLELCENQLLFFGELLHNEHLEIKTALIIYNLISKNLIEENTFVVLITKLLGELISRFKEEEIVVDLTVKLVKVCLAIYYANFKKLTEKRKSMTKREKLEGEELMAKLKNVHIEYFIGKIVIMKNEVINQEAQVLICLSYVQMKDSPHVEHLKGLQKIIGLLGNFQQLVNKYVQEVKQEAESKMKQSKVHKNKDNTEHNPGRYQDNPNQAGETDHIKSSALMNSKAKRSNSSHPMSLSFAGVAMDAHKGLQKYQKHYLKKIEHVEFQKVKQSEGEERTVRLIELYHKKMIIEKGIAIKGVAEEELQYLFEFDSKEKLIEDKHIMSLLSFTNHHEEDRDIQGLENCIKKYERVMKLYYNIYSRQKLGNMPKYFDQIQTKNNFIHCASIAKLLKDHAMDQFLLTKEIQHITKRINYQKNKDNSDFQMLDFQGFKEFIIQASYVMFTRPPKDLRGHPVSEMVEETFSYFKAYAAQNKISPQMLEDPEASYTNEGEAIKELNKKLAQNIEYILPEGYKKIVDTRVNFEYRIYLEAMTPTYKDVYEVVDDIFQKAFGFHVIEPFTKEYKVAKARPSIYLLQRVKTHNFMEKNLSVALKKEVMKFPIKDRETANQSASALMDILTAVELNHDEIGMKLENSVIKSRKFKEEEIRLAKEEEDKKRMLYDKQIKSVVQQYKEKKEQHKEKEEKDKITQKKKKQEENQKKQLYEKGLKAKVQEFNQKKKQEEWKQRKQKKSKERKEREEIEKKKKQFDQIKKKIDETKRKKEDQQKEQKEKDQEEVRKKKNEEKRRFDESQKEKKQKIEEYKQKKKQGGVNKSEVQKVMDSAKE